jgi:hypothetical protein
MPKKYLFSILCLNLCIAVNWELSTSLSSFEFSSKDSSELSVPFKLDTEKQDDPAPVIEHALDVTERANTIQKMLGRPGNSTNPNCTNCSETETDFRYMQCNSQNDYLEKDLSNEFNAQSSPLGAILRMPIQTPSIIKPACIRISMESRFNANSRLFRECSADGKQKTAFRPCISKNYFALVNNSFNVVSSCMKEFIAPGASEETQNLDVRAVFALINVESGFHLNATSTTGAGGIGQFTNPAIQDVNVNELRDIRISLEGNPNRMCGEMSLNFLDSLEPIRTGLENSCDRTSIFNGNPVKNMIYTFAYLSGIKRDMERMIFTDKNYQNKFALSEYDLNKIKRALMIWSHNAGPAGTWTPVKSLLNTAYRGKKVTDPEKFINEIQQYMQKLPASANKSSSRRRETSKYFPAITSTLKAIEENVGGGSCVN